MRVFKLADVSELLARHGLEHRALIDITVDFDGRICLFLTSSLPEALSSSGRVYVLLLDVDWERGEVRFEERRDLGVQEKRYGFLRPYGDGFLLLSDRCRFRNGRGEPNAAIVSADGTLRRALCLGDGIRDCITATDRRIIVGYFDEGIYGGNGWKDPIGRPGVIVWDGAGNILWKNEKYDIRDCYAMNLDSAGRLWFYYYMDFNLVCASPGKDTVLRMDIRGSEGFALSRDQKRLMMAGGYDDDAYYLLDRAGGKRREPIICGGDEIAPDFHFFCGTKLIFLARGGGLYGCDFL